MDGWMDGWMNEGELYGLTNTQEGESHPVSVCSHSHTHAPITPRITGRRLQELSWAIADPVWQMPLYQGYRKHLKSNLADMRNTGAGGRCVGVGIVAG